MAKINKSGILEVKSLLFRFLKEWKLFAVSIFASVLIFVLFIKIVSPVYRVNSNIVVKEDKDGMSSMNPAKSLGFGFGGALGINDELEILRSYSLIKQVVKALNLNQTITETKMFLKKEDKYNCSAFKLDYDEALSDTLSSWLSFSLKTDKKGLVDVKIKDKNDLIFSQKKISLPHILKTKYGNFVLSTTDYFESDTKYNYNIYIENYASQTESLKDKLSVFLASKKSNVISFLIDGTNIDKSKDILNTLVSIYNRDALVEKSLVAENTENFIASRLIDLTKELTDAESDIKNYKIDNNFLDIASESSFMSSKTKDIQERLVNIGTQLSILDYTENYLANEDNKYSLIPATIGLSEGVAMGAIGKYNEAILERIKLLKTTSDENPIMDIANGSIDALRVSVLQSLYNVREGLLISEKELLSKRDDLLVRFKEAPEMEKDFRELQRNRSIKERLVVYLMEKKEENAIAKAIAEPKAKIVDTAYNLKKPIFPKKIVILIAMLAAGAMLPAIYILIIDSLKDTFESKQELEELTDIPILGEVCVNENNENNVVISKESVSPIAELFRLIRGNINFIISKKNENVLLVTSTRSGEGKSFFSINMALSLALISKRILLIGLDIRNPKLSEYMHLDNTRKGITNYLSDESIQISDIIEKSNYAHNLDVIAAGPVPPNPGELLLSNRLDDLIDKLKSEYDYIVIDSAPVGMVSDSFSLTRLSNMTLYVTRANYTERTNIPFIESLAMQNRLRKMYLIVNGTEFKSKYGAYRYGYGYGATKSK